MGGMVVLSSRWSSQVILAAATATLVLTGTPGVAAAEGPGYGGKADKLILKREQAAPGKPKDPNGEVAVFGVGFRGGSKVTLRVGSGGDSDAVTDEVGTLHVLVTAQVVPGTTIIAVGQTPSGSAWTLVGSVPSDQTSKGPRDFTSWIIGGLGLLGLAGAFLPRLRRARQGSKR
jgi:MYXO-CTERM domain-containing protein